MLGNLEAARYVSELFLEMNGRLNESIETVQNTCAPEEASAYRRRIGTLVNSVFEEILEPIYAEHPQLKPPELEN